MKNIKIPEETYNLFLEKYEKLHEDILECINHCEQELMIIMNSERGFHADMISEKLDMMLEILHQVRLPYLKEGFLQIEESVEEYLKIMRDSDTV